MRGFGQYPRLKRISALSLFLIAAQPGVSPAGSDLDIRKEMIEVSPPGKSGYITVRGTPGAVRCPSLVVFVVENDDTGSEVSGAVHTDGSFLARIKASPEDKIKLYFKSTQTGKKKKIKRRVPHLQAVAPAGGRREAPAVRKSRSAPAPVPVSTPAIVIRYKGGASPAEKGASENGELVKSGILPPD